MTITLIPALNDMGRFRRTHYQSTCWKVVANDDSIVRVTDCFEELEIQESDDLGALFTYSPIGGFDATAQQRLLEVGANNAELIGIVVEAVFTVEDMAKGKWIGAKIDAFRVDFRTPFLGYKQHKRYFIRKTKTDGAEWLGDITTLEGFLFGNIGERWGPRCRVALFSQGVGKCNISASAFEETDEQVTAVTSRVKFRVSTVSPWTTEADYGQDGTVTFTLGNNSGISRKISKSTPISGPTVEIETYESFPAAIDVLDEVTILPGCNKQPGTEDTDGHCKQRYDNFVNFQAEHKIPGPDKVTEVA